jgi:hypothetical protein
MLELTLQDYSLESLENYLVEHAEALDKLVLDCTGRTVTKDLLMLCRSTPINVRLAKVTPEGRKLIKSLNLEKLLFKSR